MLGNLALIGEGHRIPHCNAQEVDEKGESRMIIVAKERSAADYGSYVIGMVQAAQPKCPAHIKLLWIWPLTMRGREQSEAQRCIVDWGDSSPSQVLPMQKRGKQCVSQWVFLGGGSVQRSHRFLFPDSYFSRMLVSDISPRRHHLLCSVPSSCSWIVTDESLC